MFRVFVKYFLSVLQICNDMKCSLGFPSRTPTLVILIFNCSVLVKFLVIVKFLLEDGADPISFSFFVYISMLAELFWSVSSQLGRPDLVGHTVPVPTAYHVICSVRRDIFVH